jgi:hypothetical protein
MAQSQVKTMVERAFELASQCLSNRVIRARLKTEGFSHREITAHFNGKDLRRRLKALRLARQG